MDDEPTEEEIQRRVALYREAHDALNTAIEAFINSGAFGDATGMIGGWVLAIEENDYVNGESVTRCLVKGQQYPNLSLGLARTLFLAAEAQAERFIR